MPRKLAIGFGLIIGLVVIAALGVYLRVLTSLPRTEGTVVVEGVSAPVEIFRDPNAVPHIFAESAEDAYFGLGYVHAQDRLWQMEFTRRLGAGRLAEILGEDVLQYDRYFRTLGVYRLSEANFRRLPQNLRQVFAAYADGVNAWLATRSGALPPEFLLFRLEPEPWRPADSLVWGRLMAMRLGRNWRTELLRAGIQDVLARNGLPAELLNELWQPVSVTASTTGARLPHASLLSLTLLAALPSEDAYGRSSNAWVVDGTRTPSGKPILANDPHLAFSAPAIWYLARLEAPGLRLVGATFPGAPLTIVGHNGRVAWGFTNGYGDVEDVFLEAVDPGDAGRYLGPEGPRDFDKRVEDIPVKGGETVRLTIRESRHGPIISDISPPAAEIAGPGRVAALASVALAEDDRTMEALYAINQAGNTDELRLAAADFHTPHQNLLFATTDGDVGFLSAGRLPARVAGDGRLPVPGTDGSHDWEGFVTAGALPHVVNPASGRIVNANNRIVSEDYPILITSDWPPPSRARRIEELLDGSAVHDVAGMASLQNDIRSPAAQHLLPLMLAFEPVEGDARAAHRLLAAWDHVMRRDRPEPLIYAAWLRQLIVALIDDELGQELVDRYLDLTEYPSLGLVEAVLGRDSHWCDDIATEMIESCVSRLGLSLRRALEEITAEQGPDMSSWRWGDVHRATFTHRILTRVPILRYFADLEIESDGGDHTVNRGTTPRARPDSGFRHLDGSGFRAIYDLSDLDGSLFIIAPGQSGNFLSRHYEDLLRRWRDGEYIRIAGTREDLARTADPLVLAK
ncbi:MAG: penicillin acylase family protein [Alphaproteobacteria bacterium]|jgi:penicillin amidase|nr:penicillin acylase family protein [Alphaproteobacteria bacterium]MDP6516235.1 penicillin acylase family protein [Alphaproteobacteria bacterium]